MSLLIAVLFFVGVLAMDLTPVEPFAYRPGQYVDGPIRGRIGFSVLNQSRMEQKELRVPDTVPATFRFNVELADEIVTALTNLPERTRAATQPADVGESLTSQFGTMAADALAAWQEKADGEQRSRYLQNVQKLRRDLEELILVRVERVPEQEQRSVSQIKLVGASTSPRMRNIRQMIGLHSDAARDVNQRVSELVKDFDPRLREGLRFYLINLFLAGEGRPTYRYDAAATSTDVAEAIAALRANPPADAYESYQTGQVLVPAGTVLTQAHLNVLQREHQEFIDARLANRPWLLVQIGAARAVLVLVVTVLLCAYVVSYLPQMLRDHRRALAVAMTMLLMLGVVKALYYGLGLNPYIAVFSVLMVTVVMAIVYDQRSSLAFGLMVSILAVLQMRSQFYLFMALLGGVVACAFLLREVRTRTKIIRVSGVAAMAVFGVAVANNFVQDTPWRFTLIDSAWAAGAALLMGLVAQGGLPLIERVFGVATSLTLLDLCDASRPLLKRLATEATGTYNHCLQLGAMCEAAADSIGAKGLLARVGAYYHDIGKINKPEYFVENQAGGPSKHVKLSPAMSLLIILGHVKDGLEMAREYALPEVLHEFIATHHGTTLVQYFYHAATEQRKAEMQRAPEEVEFRYPGPKPRSKEAAILMLADAAESSVRSMTEPTPGRIENQVNAMVTRRLEDGQLDECELTLKEVHQIEASLVRSLCSFYHSRIAYPTPAGQKPSAAETQRQRKLAEQQPSPEQPQTRS